MNWEFFICFVVMSSILMIIIFLQQKEIEQQRLSHERTLDTVFKVHSEERKDLYNRIQSYNLADYQKHSTEAPIPKAKTTNFLRDSLMESERQIAIQNTEF